MAIGTSQSAISSFPYALQGIDLDLVPFEDKTFDGMKDSYSKQLGIDRGQSSLDVEKPLISDSSKNSEKTTCTKNTS